MDIKQYIDYFEEISHLERSEQFRVLETARDEVHAKYKFPILTILPQLIRFIILVLLCGGSYVLFGYALWIVLLSALVGIILSRVVVTEIKDSLLKKAINRNL